MGAEMKLNVGVPGLKRGSNVLDIKIPPELDMTVKTGIKWFDKLLSGGWTPSTACMLTGVPGGGKTTLCLAVADALTGMGHIPLFNTNEESLYQVRKTLRRLNAKNGFEPGQDEFVTEVIEHAMWLQKNAKAKGLKAKDGTPAHVVILQDSLQTLDDGKYAHGGRTGNTPVRCCEKLVEWCKSTYGICVFVGQVTKGGEYAGKGTIKHAVDQHVHGWFDLDKKSETWGERLFEIRKNRFGVSGRTFIVGIDERGVYPKGEVHYASEAARPDEE